MSYLATIDYRIQYQTRHSSKMVYAHLIFRDFPLGYYFRSASLTDFTFTPNFQGKWLLRLKLKSLKELARFHFRHTITNNDSTLTMSNIRELNLE